MLQFCFCFLDIKRFCDIDVKSCLRYLLLKIRCAVLALQCEPFQELNAAFHLFPFQRGGVVESALQSP
ncbi:hypothetical protein D3C80_2088780 [compost metagenome]